MLQIFDSTRTCSLLDVACNFVGTVGGIAVALIFRREIFAITRRRTGDRGAGGALCWPLLVGLPVVSLRSALQPRPPAANIARFLATPDFACGCLRRAAEWFAFALVVRAVTGRRKPRGSCSIMLCLPLRLLIMERSLTPAELLGAALALVAWTCPAKTSRVRAGAGILAAAIVLRELAPFTFTAPVRSISWIPFAATLNSERLNATLVLLRKAFEYGTLLWLLRASGLRYWTAGAWVAGSLMLLETAQLYLPNRQAEVTDAVIAIILACILWGSERRVTQTNNIFRSP